MKKARTRSWKEFEELNNTFGNDNKQFWNKIRGLKGRKKKGN